MSPMPTTTTVEINGYACRELRIRSGLDIAPFAAQVGIQRASMANIELGYRQRVSAKTFAKILAALAITDRRVLLANPHGAVEAEAVAS